MSGRTVSARRFQSESCHHPRHLTLHEENGMDYVALILGKQNTDMGIRRGEKTTGGRGHTTGP